MTTQWISSPSPSPLSWGVREVVKSDYEPLRANDNTIIQDNTGDDIIIHSGGFYASDTEWTERTPV